MKKQVLKKQILLSMFMTGGILFSGYATVNTSIDVDYNLNPLIITSQRVQTQELETPSSTTVLTKEDLKNTGAQTLFEALSFTTGLSNYAYEPSGIDMGPMSSYTNMRGLEKGAIILLDGAPVSLNGKNSMAGIPLESVEKIEVVRGAASALYGAEALAGVINVITKKGGAESSGRASFTLGNYGTREYEVSVQGEKFFFNFDQTYRGSIDRSSPDRAPTRMSKYSYYNARGEGDSLAVFGKVQLGKDWAFSYSHSEINSIFSQISTEENRKAQASHSKDTYFNDVIDRAALQYDKDTVKGAIFFSNRNLTGEFQTYDSDKRVENDSNFTARKIGTDWQKTWEWRGGKDVFIGGISAVRDTYNGESKANSVARAGRNSYALYGSYERELSPKWSTTLGLRYQYIDDPIKNQNVIVPQWQTLYKINDTSSIYTNIGKSFTMPSLSDAYTSVRAKKMNGEKKLVQVTGRDLKPEEGWNYEVGYKKLFAKGSLKVALYHMDFSNFFIWQKDENGDKTIRANGGKLKNTGMEIEYKHRINDTWSYRLSGSYSNPQSQENEGDNWERALPKVQFGGQLAYAKNKWEAATSLNILASRVRKSDGTYNPNLVSWNGYITYKFTKNDKVRFTVNNILNRSNVITNGDMEYWDMPRNYRIQYEHRF